MGEVLPFERPDKAKRLAKEVWKWTLWRFHVYQWQDVETSNLIRTNRDNTRSNLGIFVLQKCSVPGCGKYRSQSLYIK